MMSESIRDGYKITEIGEMPEEWEPWKVIASNSYEHYHQHIPGIRAWLDEVKKAL